MKPTRILDFHAHFPAKVSMNRRVLHPAVQAYSESLRETWRQVWGFPEPEKRNPGNKVQAGRWVEEVHKYGLKKVVFMTGGGNDTLAEIVKQHPQEFMGFAHHDLTEPDAVEKMKKALNKGLVGYKWFGPMTKVPFEDPELKPFWTLLAERKVPVLIHFGVLGGPGGIVNHPRISPITLAEVVQTYVDIPFIIPHFGAGYFQDLLHLAWSSPNVFMDTSGSNDWLRWAAYPLTIKDVFNKALETVGPSRVIFATDSSWFPRGWAKEYFEVQTGVCSELGLTQQELDQIFYGNGAKLLGLSE